MRMRGEVGPGERMILFTREPEGSLQLRNSSGVYVSAEVKIKVILMLSDQIKRPVNVTLLTSVLTCCGAVLEHIQYTHIYIHNVFIKSTHCIFNAAFIVMWFFSLFVLMANAFKATLCRIWHYTSYVHDITAYFKWLKISTRFMSCFQPIHSVSLGGVNKRVEVVWGLYNI